MCLKWLKFKIYIDKEDRNIYILYYTILYYTILYYTILYNTILYYTILYYTILYYTILYYTILYYTILYYTILYYTVEKNGKGEVLQKEIKKCFLISVPHVNDAKELVSFIGTRGELKRTDPEYRIVLLSR